MDIQLTTDVPGFKVNPSMLFAYPSAIADLYTPSIERIYLPEEIYPDQKYTIRVATGHTGPLKTGSTRWKMQRKLKYLFKTEPTLNYADQFIFDARFDTDRNVAHIVGRVSAKILLARKLLSEHLNQDVTIHVVLSATPSNVAKQAYDTLNIPIITTDDNVYGNIIYAPESTKLYGLIPKIFDVPIKNYNPDTPERVFIPRRGNRYLINNDEVTQFFEERGFKTLYFEDLTISEEWSIARNAKVAAVVHGAAWGHFDFNQVGLKTPNEPESGLKMLDIYSPAFMLGGKRYIAAVLNGKWSGVRGQITPKVVRELDFKDRDLTPLKSPVKDPYRVSLETLKMALNFLGVDQ